MTEIQTDTGRKAGEPFLVAALYHFVSVPRFAELRAPLQALCEDNGVRGTLLAGDRLHLDVDDGPQRIPQLRAHLASAGVPFEEILLVEPTLEDLFVAMVEGKIPAAA